MGDNFDFLIITRFNLKHGFTKINVNDPEWLNYRFDLFEKYCMPSVKSQTFQGFKWLIFFDEELPEEFRAKFAKYKQTFENLEAVYLPEFSFESMRSVCKSYSTKDYLISSRLDSDDLLSKNYVSDVVDLFENQDDLLINFHKGFCYVPSQRLANEVDYYLANPFMAYIEKSSENLKTVFIDKHTQLKTYPNSINIFGKRNWCIIIHESNVINRIIGKPKLVNDLNDYFPLSAIKDYEGKINKNYLKFYIVYLVKFLKKKIKNLLFK